MIRFSCAISALILAGCAGSLTPTSNVSGSSAPTAAVNSSAKQLATRRIHPTQYSDGNLPPVGWQFPFATNPFTVPVCSSDPCSPGDIDQNSTSEINFLMQNAGSFNLGEIQEAEPGTNGSGQVDTFPLYYSSASDPSYTVTCSKFGGCGGFLPSSINIPNGAQASIDSDHHATVIELFGTAYREIDFWEFNGGTNNPVSGGGPLTVGYADYCVVTSLNNMGRCQGSAVAAAVPVEPGVLDPREFSGPGGGLPIINQVIYVSVNCPSSGHVWPAVQSDGTCPSGPADGERIWLNLTDQQINNLPNTYLWAKTLLHQMHHYGLMVVDTAGSGPVPWNFYGIDNATLTLWGEPAPWTTFFNLVANEGDQQFGWSHNASHLPIPIGGISQSNVEVIDQNSP